MTKLKSLCIIMFILMSNILIMTGCRSAATLPSADVREDIFIETTADVAVLPEADTSAEVQIQETTEMEVEKPSITETESVKEEDNVLAKALRAEPDKLDLLFEIFKEPVYVTGNAVMVVCRINSAENEMLSSNDVDHIEYLKEVARSDEEDYLALRKCFVAISKMDDILLGVDYVVDGETMVTVMFDKNGMIEE